MKTFAFPAATVAAAIAVGAAIVVDVRALLLVPLAAVVVCVLRSAAGAAFAAEDGLFGLVILAWLFAPLLRARGRAGAATAAVVGLSLLFFDFQNWPAAQGLLALGLGLAALPNHATAKVVTVPDDPLYVSAPATT